MQAEPPALQCSAWKSQPEWQACPTPVLERLAPPTTELRAQQAPPSWESPSPVRRDHSTTEPRFFALQVHPKKGRPSAAKPALLTPEAVRPNPSGLAPALVLQPARAEPPEGPHPRKELREGSMRARMALPAARTLVPAVRPSLVLAPEPQVQLPAAAPPTRVREQQAEKQVQRRETQSPMWAHRRPEALRAPAVSPTSARAEQRVLPMREPEPQMERRPESRADPTPEKAARQQVKRGLPTSPGPQVEPGSACPNLHRPEASPSSGRRQVASTHSGEAPTSPPLQRSGWAERRAGRAERLSSCGVGESACRGRRSARRPPPG